MSKATLDSESKHLLDGLVKIEATSLFSLRGKVRRLMDKGRSSNERSWFYMHVVLLFSKAKIGELLKFPGLRSAGWRTRILIENGHRYRSDSPNISVLDLS